MTKRPENSLLLLCALCVSAVIPSPAHAQADPYETYIKTSKDFKPVSQNKATLIKAWPTFVYMPWTFQWTIGYTPDSGKWSRENGYNGAFIDREPSGNKLDWINENKLPFYVDHTAGKGDLHLWDGIDKKHLADLHGTGVRIKPVNAAMATRLKALIKQHIEANKSSPYRAAYALDDELSWGHFVHPAMWQITDDKQAYPNWLKEIYGDAAPKRTNWISYNDLLPKLKTWSIAEFDASQLMDQWTFNDAYWANFLGDLVEYANSIDPATPVGFVGGQSPNAFGGFDYARLMRKIQFIEAYNIGSSQAVIRSFNPGNAIPAVTTHFHRDVADTVWQSWYYLAHGNKGFIGWVQGWFDGKTPKPFHEKIAPTFLEVEKLSSLMTGATWQHDGIAIYYSQPSIQLSWIMDAQAHGKTWTNRNNDHRLGSSHLVHHAWENMLRDEGLQYNFLSYIDVIQNGIPKEYKVLILPACLCLSDAEARQIRQFVNEGGTVIADYLPGLWDQHGKGRQTGVLDDLFNTKESGTMHMADIFGGNLWCETDQDANFSYKTYEALLTNKNSCIKDATGFDRAIRAVDAPSINHAGKGSAVLLNLSPQWYNAYRVAGAKEAAKRNTFLSYLPVKPWVRVNDPAGKSFGAEITCWQNNGRTIVFVTYNPEVTGDEKGGGNSTGLKSDTVAITLDFTKPIASVRDERAGKPLADGSQFKFDWKMDEAVVLSFETPK